MEMKDCLIASPKLKAYVEEQVKAERERIVNGLEDFIEEEGLNNYRMGFTKFIDWITEEEASK